MANSTIKAMATTELATPNSAYVGFNQVYVTKVGKLVNVSGRFNVTTEKPSGGENYLFSGLPSPKGLVIGFDTLDGVELIINQSGWLTSNSAILVGARNIQFTYCEA